MAAHFRNLMIILGPKATVVLHYSVWKNQFHSDPSVIGKTVSLSGQGYTVIGVMSPGFRFPAGAQVWTLLGLDAQWMNRDATFLQVIGRLKAGVSLQQTRDDIAGAMTQLAHSILNIRSGRILGCYTVG